VSPRVGYTGKLPSRGDFVSAGLPPGFAEPWDAWLQSVVEGVDWAGLATGGEKRDLRFALGPGVAGVGPLSGLLLPSVDAVGRWFPLTIVAPLSAAEAGNGWFALAEATVGDALAETTEPDALDAALARLAAPVAPAMEVPAAGFSHWWEGAQPGALPLRCVGLPGAAEFSRLLASGPLDGNGEKP
jgi:type VI secretion system protein ImpM